MIRFFSLRALTLAGTATATLAAAFLAGMVWADVQHSRSQPSPTAAPPSSAPIAPAVDLEAIRAPGRLAEKTVRDQAADLVRVNKLLEAARAQVHVLLQDRDQWQAHAKHWETQARENARIATHNHDASESWRRAALQTVAPAGSLAEAPPAPIPAPHLDTPLHRALHEDPPAAPTPTRSRFSHVIDTGYGTATVIGPDGRQSFIQSTGEGTATIWTPGK